MAKKRERPGCNIAEEDQFTSRPLGQQPVRIRMDLDLFQWLLSPILCDRVLTDPASPIHEEREKGKKWWGGTERKKTEGETRMRAGTNTFFNPRQ